ncbi:MAG: hypothetical protein HZB09_01875 [Candidatus Yonathbacteria bacterium]|nr:hypothetical protein [Candidatus Yonathbacteria bacterium]
MNERKNRTPINLKNGIKTTREKEATILLGGTLEKLNVHKRELISGMGKVSGMAYFQTNCGDLHSFIEERIKEGLDYVTVRIIGRSKKDKNFLQFAFTDKDGVGYSCTVHKDCLQDPKKLHPSQFLYEPIPAQIAA